MKLNSKEISNTISIFERIGKEIMLWRKDQSKREIISKKSNKYIADKLAHEFIVKELKNIYPGVDIVSEEDENRNIERSSEYWIIDPIDGTLSWANGYKGFVTQGAFIVNDQPILSVVSAPCFAKTYTAIADKGFYINDVLFRRSLETNVVTLVDNTPKPHGITKYIIDNLDNYEYIESGSLGLKCCLIADGSANVFVKNTIVRDWDIAPIIPIIKEANCRISLLDGSEYILKNEFEKDGIIVSSNNYLHKKILKIIKLYE